MNGVRPRYAQRRFDHDAARELRARGWRIQAIADQFGVNTRTISVVCKGVVCPVDHRSMVGKANLLVAIRRQIATSDAKRAGARQLFSTTKMSLTEIACATGYSPATVRDVCRGLKRPEGLVRRGPGPGVVPAWVPQWHWADYRRHRRLYGEQKAASLAREAKREASSCA